MLRLTRKGDTPDIQRSRVLQSLGAIGHRAAGGYNVVNEYVATVLHIGQAFKGFGDVLLAVGGRFHADLRGRIAGAAQGCGVHWDAGNAAEFARDKLGLVEAATAFSPWMERHWTKGIYGIRVALQICGEKARDVRHGDSHIAVLEVVDDAAGAAMELVGCSHAVECGCKAPARIAELRDARGGAEEAIRTLERWQVGFAIGTEITALALADYAILR